jgi:hypothetical protein
MIFRQAEHLFPKTEDITPERPEQAVFSPKMAKTQITRPDRKAVPECHP